MSRSYWSEDRTVGAVVVAFLVFVFFGSVALVVSQFGDLHQSYAQYQANTEKNQNTARKSVEQVCSSIGVIRPDCFVDAVEAYEKQKETNSDLQAQQDMAFWAKWVFILGAVQAVLSGFGLIYLVKSVRQAGTAISTATKANTITREMGEAQTRAYLSIVKVQALFNFPAQKPVIRLTVRNTGKSPAIEVTAAYKTRMQTKGNLTPEREPSSQLLTFHMGAEKDEFDINLSEVVLSQPDGDPASHGIALYFDVLISYRTVFGTAANKTERDCFFTGCVGGNLHEIHQLALAKTFRDVCRFHVHFPVWMRDYIKANNDTESRTGRREDGYSSSELYIVNTDEQYQKV